MTEKPIGFGEIVSVLYEGDEEPTKVMLVSEQQKKRGEIPQDVFAITMVSPLAQALLGKMPGDKVSFERGDEHVEIEIMKPEEKKSV